jgi:hypothetical protein
MIEWLGLAHERRALEPGFVATVVPPHPGGVPVDY